jgi:hypothetical protein
MALTDGTRLAPYEILAPLGGPYEPTVFTVANYDVAPDGLRFLMLKHSEQEAAAPTHINVMLNRFEELKRRAPPGKK